MVTEAELWIVGALLLGALLIGVSLVAFLLALLAYTKG